MTTAEPKTLPPGWVETKLGDLHPEFQNGLSKRVGVTGMPVTVLRLADVKNDRLSLGSPRRILLSDAEKRKYAVTNNDLLAIRVNGSAELVGRFVLQSFPDEALAYCDHFIRLRFQEGTTELRFINYMSKGSYARQQIESNFVTTAGQKTINQGHIAGLTFPLPPLAEQIRIADKLDTLLARVDTGRERLERLPKLVKQFRQAVLSAAVSGELTREWRGGRDAAWEQVEFSEACTDVTVGFVGKMADEYRDEGVPFLRSQNVRPFRFDPRNLLHVSEQFHRTIKKSALRPGDVVVVRSGAPGQCCVIPESLPEANCSDLVIIRPGKQLNSAFACIFINSETSQEFVRAERVGVAQAHFNVGSMKRTPLSLPSLPEQLEIVRRVEALFGIADRLEQRYEATLASFDRLTPALLAKAFRGELVPQDPNDEPASVLLERIQAQRASAPGKVKRGRSAKASQDTADQGEAAPARRRGRPRKSEAAGAQDPLRS